MTQDTRYAPIEMTYESKGLIARYVPDQAPPHTYLNLLNCLERAENSMSSRYGTQIINRDPAGTGTANYYFSNPVTSLARLTYLGSPYRYAGTSDGKLWRRPADTQGAYTQIDTGLSGEPFQAVVTNCFQSSQAYIFIYDANISVKDTGTFSAPQLTGIDPPVYTGNTVPYSPLLTLIDNFKSTNTYTSAGFDGAGPWTYGPLITLAATSSQLVTDFYEFLGVGVGGSPETIAGGSTATTAAPPTTTTNSTTYSGFASAVPTPTEQVTLSMVLSGGVAPGLTPFTGSGTVTLSYSQDGGATFTPFYTVTAPPGAALGVPLSVPLVGVTNLNLIQVKADVSATGAPGGRTITTTAILGTITATISTSNAFGPVVNGMLSFLGNESSVNITIDSVITSGLTSGLYQTLTVNTTTAHGLSVGQRIAIYGSSNTLVDGFYMVATTPTATQFTVLIVGFGNPVLTGSTGGNVYGGAPMPETCVLANLYSAPYIPQMSAWGFYEAVPAATASFPVGAWSGLVDVNSTATVGKTININLDINGQATDDDLIVVTLAVSDPAAISNIRLQFDINGSGYTSSYYYKDISPSFYQGNVAQTVTAYDSTEQQILADTLGLITGQVPGTTAAQLQPANISTGNGSWVAIYMRRGDFVPVGTAGQAGSAWSAITGWQVVFTTNTTGDATVAMNGLYFQWGYGPSSFGGIGYDYRYTYWNSATGTESNGSPIQQFSEDQGYLPSLSSPFFLRQASQLTGQYSSDPQVTHLRIYRRGGTFAQNWYLIDTVPNITGTGFFTYKDVVADAALQQAPILVLDNDPPVTSTLQNPISTTLAVLTISTAYSTIYSPFVPQTITVVNSSAVFVEDQIVDVGDPQSLEQVRVIAGGVGSFTAILRLQHNVGEPVSVFSIPRQPCTLCALAYDQVWLAGDPNNPNYLYFSKKNLPESFGPQNHIPVGESGDIINIVVNWRGTLFVATDKSWYSIIGGPSPRAQPTGAGHGAIASQGWTQSETAIWFRAADGYREFTGANGQYATLPVEFIFRPNPTPPLTPVPLADPTQATADVMAFYNNSVYCSYISTTNSGQRFRLNYDTNYRRFRNDDVPATAMLWEKDTNTFLVGKQIGVGQYAVVQDQVGDYDDGGWSGSELVKVPVNWVTQTPYGDQGKPHFPKQYNVLETDVNTQAQTLNTTLLFDTEPPLSIVLDTANTGTERNKVQLKVNNGLGQEAYSMSILHSMSVLVAPTLYQENIYAAVLAAVRNSFDTYWEKFGTDASKLVKEAYFDYTSSAAITVSVYADGSITPYYTVTLPINAQRMNVPMRVRFPAIKLRQFRCVAVSSGDFQLWNNPVLLWKAIKVGTGYANYEFAV